MLTQTAVVNALKPYIKQQLLEGVPLKSITRHILGLFKGGAGAKQWRRYLSQHAHLSGMDETILESALSVALELSDIARKP